MCEQSIYNIVHGGVCIIDSGIKPTMSLWLWYEAHHDHIAALPRGRCYTGPHCPEAAG